MKVATAKIVLTTITGQAWRLSMTRKLRFGKLTGNSCQIGDVTNGPRKRVVDSGEIGSRCKEAYSESDKIAKSGKKVDLSA